MELSEKMVTTLLLCIISFGGIMGGFDAWKRQTSTSMEENSSLYPQEIQPINEMIKDKSFPIIKAEDIYVRQHKTFNAMDHVVASDSIAGDITQRVQAYGDVDTNTKGEYQIRYVVRNDFGLKTTKHMKVIVD